MYILFSPSEEKIKQENRCKIEELEKIFLNLNYEKFFIKSSFRKDFITKYIQNFNNLEEIFGVKDVNCIINNFSTKTFKAINLYQGVSYKELDYDNLPLKAKEYLDNNLIIFSNLFGPVLASDELVFYKLKQGIKLNKINQAKEYKIDTSKQLDELLNGFVIDLRAEIYKDYYEIKIPSVNFVFMKNNKQLSHSSKVYRGRVLRLLAINDITNIKELSNMILNEFCVIKTEKENNKTIFYIDIKD